MAICAVAVLLTLLVYGQIVKRAGFSRWWSLLTLIPVVGWFMPIVFAFSDWPAERSSAKTRKRKRKARSSS